MCAERCTVQAVCHCSHVFPGAAVPLWCDLWCGPCTGHGRVRTLRTAPVPDRRQCAGFRLPAKVCSAPAYALADHCAKAPGNSMARPLLAKDRLEYKMVLFRKPSNARPPITPTTDLKRGHSWTRQCGTVATGFWVRAPWAPGWHWAVCRCRHSRRRPSPWAFSTWARETTTATTRPTPNRPLCSRRCRA